MTFGYLWPHCCPVCLSGRPYGADDFLPMLTHVLAQCDMPQLDNEILYMMELLDPSLLHGEGVCVCQTGEPPSSIDQDAEFRWNNSLSENILLLTLRLCSSMSRWLLPDQRLWSHVADQKLPGGAGSQSAEFWNQEHAPPVAPPTHHLPALYTFHWWLPGKNTLESSFTSVMFS